MTTQITANLVGLFTEVKLASLNDLANSSKIKIKTKEGKSFRLFCFVCGKTQIEVDDLYLYYQGNLKHALRYHVDDDGWLSFWHATKSGIAIVGDQEYICSIPENYSGPLPAKLHNKFVEMGLITDKGTLQTKRLHKTSEEITQETEKEFKPGDFVRNKISGVEGTVYKVFLDCVAVTVGHSNKVCQAEKLEKIEKLTPVSPVPATKLPSGKPKPQRRHS